MPGNADNHSPPAATLVRRLLAVLYDALLLIGILFVASIFAIALNHGNAIEPSHPAYPAYLVYLISIAFLFYGWFWTHGGQTLGMKTWKLRLLNEGNGTVSWKQALIRYCVAMLSWASCGLGFLWSLADRDRRTWHDIASDTRLIDTR
jgi:uncharacterized RDD family membrane protein YckC